MGAEKILFSFIGSNDPFRANEAHGHEGPLLSLLSSRTDFRVVVLMYTEEAGYSNRATKTKETIGALSPVIRVEIESTNIKDPTSYEDILPGLRRVFDKYFADVTTPEKWFFAVTSGTPSIHASLLLLAASGEYPADLLYLREPWRVPEGEDCVRTIDPRSNFPQIPFYTTPRVVAAGSALPDKAMINDTIKNLEIIGDCSNHRMAVVRACKVAITDEPVLLLGESGTGKEQFANLIHMLSPRNAHKIVPINCGGLHENLVESEFFGHKKGAFTGAYSDRKGAFAEAQNGTLFLDEIGELSPSSQVKLLRVLQGGPYSPLGSDDISKSNARVVAATNRDLAIEVKEGRFRQDLYYRLNTITLKLPALRDRKGDILALANHFLEKAKKDFNVKRLFFSEMAKNKMLEYPWPGNIRELRSTIRRWVIMRSGPTINGDDLPIMDEYTSDEVPQLDDGFMWEKYKRSQVELLKNKVFSLALKQANYKQNAAALLLGISEVTMSGFVKKQNKNKGGTGAAV